MTPPPPAPPTVVRLARYAKTDLAEIFGDDADPFGAADLGMTWLPKDRHFGIRSNGRLVAHAGLVDVPMSIGGVPARAVGLGGVAVAPDVRGRGLARLVVAGAMEHARTSGPQYELLFCRSRLVAMYERLGWRTVPQDVLVEQPEEPMTMPLRTMWTPLRDGARWPAGPVRLLSLPM